MAQEKTEYEIERERRIAENMRKMKELGLHQSAAALNQAAQGEPKPKKPQVRKPREKVLVEVRRSSRARNLPEHFTYREEERPASIREVTRRVEKRKAGGSARQLVARSTQPGWNEGKGEASTAAADKAFDAAEEKLQELENWGYVKAMTPSMVSTGFWCSADQGMAAKVGYTNREGKHTLRFVVGGGGKPQAQDFCYRSEGPDGEECWEAVWLPHGKTKSNSWGFSGGWRGFAIDQDLYPGDALVYEAMPPRVPGKPSEVVRVYIYRAFDFETPERRAEIKAQAKAAWEAAAAGLILGGEGGAGGEGEGEEGAEGAAGPRAPGPSASKQAPGPSASGGSEGSGEAAVVEGSMMEVDSGEEEAAQGTSPPPRKRQRQSKLDDGVEQKGRKAPAAGKAAAGAAGGGTLAGGGSHGGKQQQRQKGKRPGSVAAGGKPRQGAAAASKKQQQQQQQRQRNKQRQVTEAAAASDGEDEDEQVAGAAGAEEDVGPGPVNGEDEYWVEVILGARWLGRGKHEYKIKWYGYDEITWEPPSNLNKPVFTYPLAKGVDLKVGPSKPISEVDLPEVDQPS